MTIDIKDSTEATVEYFVNKAGLRIASYAWEVANPRGAVVAVHGITSHSFFEWLYHHPQDGNEDTQRTTTYSNSWPQAANDRDLSFFGIDLQGHGRSEGWDGGRCVAEKSDDFALDVLQLVVAVVRRLHTPTSSTLSTVPVFLMGISMGGCVVTRALQLWRVARSIRLLGRVPAAREADAALLRQSVLETSSSVDIEMVARSLRGGVLLAPMLSLETVKRKFTNRVLLPFAPLVSRFLPHLPVGAIQHNGLFPWIEVDRTRDPLIYRSRIPARLSYECLKAVERVMSSVDLLADETSSDDRKSSKENLGERLSLLLIHSKMDTMCEPEGSVVFADEVKAKTVDVALWLIEDMWHYLTLEPGSDSLKVRVFDWLTSRVKSVEPIARL